MQHFNYNAEDGVYAGESKETSRFHGGGESGVENRRSRPSQVTLRCIFHAGVGAISIPRLVVPLLAHPGDVRRR